jgi:hypothetical protein
MTPRLFMRALVALALVAVVTGPACKKKGRGYLPLGSPDCGLNPSRLPPGAFFYEESGNEELYLAFALFPDGRAVADGTTINVGAASVEKLKRGLEASRVTEVPQGCWAAVEVARDGSGTSNTFRHGTATYTFDTTVGCDPPPEVVEAMQAISEFWVETRLRNEFTRARLAAKDAGSDASRDASDGAR